MGWIFALIVLAWARATGKPFSALGLTRPSGRLAPAVVAAFLFGVLFKVVMKAIVMPVFGAPSANRTYHFLAGNAVAVAAVILLMLTSGAVSEEIVYRGFLFERTRAWLGPSRAAVAVAMLVSTALFAASHYFDQGWPGVQQASFTGLTFASIYAWRKELWTVMAIHAGFDLAAIAMIYWQSEDRIAHLVFR
jgi:membrane protease YdiL (CAAX protease family)